MGLVMIPVLDDRYQQISAAVVEARAINHDITTDAPELHELEGKAPLRLQLPIE
jgi:hypothetical protein